MRGTRHELLCAMCGHRYHAILFFEEYRGQTYHCLNCSMRMAVPLDEDGEVMEVSEES